MSEPVIERWSDEDLERAAAVPDRDLGELMVRIRGLQRHFGRRHILRGLDLQVGTGETVVILGLSGSGKTTLFRHLMGTLDVEAGEVIVGNEDVSTLDTAGWDRYRRELGVVFQNAALLGSLTVEQNVGLPLTEVARLPRDQVRPKVIEALRRVFLPAEEILHLYPDNLSGGMRKRVGIARAIIQEPRLLLYDEPTTGLDPVTLAGVNRLILDLQRRLGVTSVVITHDIESAFTIANHIALLYKGRIVAWGTPDEIRDNNHPVLRQLLTGAADGPLTEGYVT